MLIRFLMYRRCRCLDFFFFSSRRRHTRYWRDWSSDVCSSDLLLTVSELYIPKFLYRILHVRPGHTVTITGLTITGGYANGSVGGGILNDHSTLHINNCTIRDRKSVV